MGCKRYADTELVGDADIEAVEERLEAAEDDGVALEPFNLEQERREGFFDEEGHYVEKKDEEEKDAWLASSEGAPHLLVPCATRSFYVCWLLA